MKKTELLKLIEKTKDDEDVNSLLSGTDIEDTFKASGLTLDAFKEKLKTDKDFKAYVESENDKYHNKALKTWKENNLEKELEPFIQTKYPDLVTDPAKKEALEAKKEIEKLKAEMAKKDLLNEAIKYATEKKLPTGFVDKFLAEDLDKTKGNLDTFATEWSKGLETMVNEKMKQSSYVPGNGTDGKPISIGASIAAQNNSAKSAPSDPWASK